MDTKDYGSGDPYAKYRNTFPTAEERIRKSSLSTELRRGRAIVISVIAVVVAVEIMTIVLSTVMSGSHRLPMQIVRFVLTVFLSVCLYTGQSWARYTLVGLFGIALILSVGIYPSIRDNANSIMLARFVVATLGYTASGLALVAIPSVGRFMEHQRRKAGFPST